MWNRLLGLHSKIKYESGVTYVYVDYVGIRESQNFTSLKRVLNRMRVKDMLPEERLSFLINKHNIMLVDVFNVQDSQRLELLETLKRDALAMNPMAVFGLSDVYKHSPNMIVFSSVSLNMQLNDVITSQLTKVVDIDEKLKMVRILDWFTLSIPDQTQRQVLLNQVFPNIDFSLFSFYPVKQAPVLNVYKTKRR
jgi:hypothetical protein